MPIFKTCLRFTLFFSCWFTSLYSSLLYAEALPEFDDAYHLSESSNLTFEHHELRGYDLDLCAAHLVFLLFLDETPSGLIRKPKKPQTTWQELALDTFLPRHSRSWSVEHTFETLRGHMDTRLGGHESLRSFADAIANDLEERQDFYMAAVNHAKGHSVINESKAHRAFALLLSANYAREKVRRDLIHVHRYRFQCQAKEEENNVIVEDLPEFFKAVLTDIIDEDKEDEGPCMQDARVVVPGQAGAPQQQEDKTHTHSLDLPFLPVDYVLKHSDQYQVGGIVGSDISFKSVAKMAMVSGAGVFYGVIGQPTFFTTLRRALRHRINLPSSDDLFSQILENVGITFLKDGVDSGVQQTLKFMMPPKPLTHAVAVTVVDKQLHYVYAPHVPNSEEVLLTELLQTTHEFTPGFLAGNSQYRIGESVVSEKKTTWLQTFGAMGVYGLHTGYTSFGTAIAGELLSALYLRSRGVPFEYGTANLLLVYMMEQTSYMLFRAVDVVLREWTAVPLVRAFFPEEHLAGLVKKNGVYHYVYEVSQ